MSITKEFINGYIEVEYTKAEFIYLKDKLTGHTISMHNSVLKILNKAIKENQKSGYYTNKNPF